MSILELLTWADLEAMSNEELDSLDRKMDMAYKDERTVKKAITLIKQARADPELKKQIDTIKEENPGIENTVKKPRKRDPGAPL
jgi:uncharacterized membrane-anchored protein YjiN (DUF445 family)